MRRLMLLAACLVPIQLLRLGGLWVLVYGPGHGQLADLLFQLCFSLLGAALLLSAAAAARRDLSLLPTPFARRDKLLAGGTAVFFLLTAFLRCSAGPLALLSLACGALATPLFEEVLFRGWVWRALEPYGPRRAWLGSSVLFGLWHLGYVPSILWRTALLGHPADPAQAVFWKLLSGTVFGLVLGLARHKTGRLPRPLPAACGAERPGQLTKAAEPPAVSAPFPAKRARGLRTGRALFFSYTSMMTGRIMGLRLVFL